MAKKAFISFDLERDRFVARDFLMELKDANVNIEVGGASKRPHHIKTQRISLLTAEMRELDYLLTLVSPAAATSNNIIEELECAKSAGLRLLGIYVGGSQPGGSLPTGLASDHMVGWDWGAIKKRLI